jgi:cellulose synthase/poly-beta-1,6-N-acetylglucosamine synthase-like glycosyltransferase
MYKKWLAVLILLAAAAAIYFGSGRVGVSHRPIVEMEGTRWREALSWDFSNGLDPRGWGWGEIKSVDGTLELADPTGEFSVYFLPVAHGSEFILETEFQVVSSSGEMEGKAHLITRDNEELQNESGMATSGGGSHVYFRQTVWGQDYAGDIVRTGSAIDYGTWHVMRLVVQRGVFSGYLDGRRLYSRPTSRASVDYLEPHLAAENGTVRFRYLKVYSRQEHNSFDPTAARAAAARLSVKAGDLPPPPAEPGARPPGSDHPWWVRLILYLFYAVIFVVCLYMCRHYYFTLNRLFGRQHHLYLDVDEANWPRVTIVIPAHNEEDVLPDLLKALLAADYDQAKLRILPINDRSEDRTRQIIDRFAQLHPGLITPFHRDEGPAGKAAALRDAMELVTDDVVLIFDADYIPGKGLIKQLVAPFFDPEVGATMGRVVPHNVRKNLLTRICDLERAGGYQVDQQARMNLNLVPQYGGTVGGVRRQALLNAGGWRTDALAEDTDATFRLLLDGWKVVYQNRSECYEQAPTTWGMRMRQILRWARGHNQVMVRYAGKLLFNGRTSFREKLDGMMLLHIYLMSAVLLIGWGLGLVLWFLGVSKPGLVIILAVTCYSTLGNFAIFFEIAAACHLDGSRERIRLLPFIFLGFLVSLVAVTRATLTQIFYRPFSTEVLWHKTEHGPLEEKWH